MDGAQSVTGALGKTPHHGPRLGPFLCWAVVFADIGTSVYYTPGILYGQVGVHAALFVAMTLVVFLLLTAKYAEVAARYPEGGGVVTVASRALHPFVGLLGGMFILVDYFLTAALSALSGVIYLSVVAPSLSHIVLPVTLLALVILGCLNWIGISESASASAVFAVLAVVSQFAVVVVVFVHVGFNGVLATFPKVFSGPHLTPISVLTGYSGAFLAFSGLESIAQLSPVMREPRQRIARQAMGLVVMTICMTSPLLTLLSTTLLDARKDDPNQYISLLARFAAGPLLGIEVALTAAALLIFASNTAIIGSYHVFLALSRMRFFPQFIEERNRLRNTPHWAILIAVGIPLMILILAQGSLALLGDLYAFGLLGAFSLTCVSLDIVRWRERRAWRQPSGRLPRWQEGEASILLGAIATPDASLGARLRGSFGSIVFGVGVLTTVLVAGAWVTNLWAKPLATLFGSGVTLFGLGVAAFNYMRLTRRGRMAPFLFDVRSVLPDCVLVLLPQKGAAYSEFANAVAASAGAHPIVFLYRGATAQDVVQPRLFQMVDPYLDDKDAQEALTQVERIARQLGWDRRYVYVPSGEGQEGILRVWRTLRPQDTVVTAGDESSVHGIAADRVRRSVGGVPLVHYLKHWSPAA